MAARGTFVMEVFDVHGNPVLLGENAGHGGEAAVYRVPGRPHLLAKIYTPAPRPGYDRKLAWMVAHPPANPAHSQNHHSLAWPVGLLYYADRRLAGYLMPYIQVAVPILEVFNPKRRAAILPRFDRRYLHRVARNLAAALGALHREGYVVGDLNESNTMVTPRAQVTLIDTDSFQVEERRNGKITLYPCPVAKYEYTPPELQGQPVGKIHRKPEHDAFGLGVLVFQLLMEGNHPFRAQWTGEGEPPPIEKRIALGGFPYMTTSPCPVLPPRNAPALHTLHPVLVELVRRCFIDGHHTPALRPEAAAWERALAEAEKALVSCPQNHLYSGHLRRCPYCLQPTVHPSAVPQEKPARQPEKNPESPRPNRIPYRPRRVSWPASTAAPAGPAAPSRPASASGTTVPRPAIFSPSWFKKATSSVTWPRSGPPLHRVGLRRWVQPRIYKSFAIGGTFGALTGAALGSLVGVASWSAGQAAAWSLLWALGGAAAGSLRGWQPGFRLSQWIDRAIGWRLFLQLVGATTGAFLGSLMGLVVGWALFPLCAGSLAGAGLGWGAGQRIWQAGRRLRWERIWGGLTAAFAALLGWYIAAWTSGSGLGLLADRFANSLVSWIMDASSSWALAWLTVGAVGGALGGAVAGVFVDLFARLSGLVD